MPLPPGFIPPYLPTKALRPPSGELWLHEIKHDGFRVIARKDDARVRLYSRPGNDLTDRFPLIVEALARLRSRAPTDRNAAPPLPTSWRFRSHARSPRRSGADRAGGDEGPAGDRMGQGRHRRSALHEGQAHAGWTSLRARYDDGGFSGGNTDRPALQRLLEDVRAGRVDVIVVYKVDRLTRSLADATPSSPACPSRAQSHRVQAQARCRRRS
jgi:hypothetical protein